LSEFSSITLSEELLVGKQLNAWVVVYIKRSGDVIVEYDTDAKITEGCITEEK
jgi:hypothetical protein